MKITNTLVSFPSGEVFGESEIIFTANIDKTTGFIVSKETPFHPLDNTWPDQPGDKGTVTIENKELEILDSITAAINQETNEYYIGKEIPVRKGTDGYAFVVAHIVKLSNDIDLTKYISKKGLFNVNKKYRHKLNACHTACHLAALALNKHTKEYWKKGLPSQDSLNNPDLDKESIQQSKISENHSKDYYRFGKSMKKKGFDIPLFFDNLKAIESKINKNLASWISSDAKIRIEAPEHQLTARRQWVCELKEGTAKIPCGGTHLSHLGQLTSIQVTLQKDDNEPEIEVTTTPILANN